MNATLTLDEAVRQPWDIVVIGAGPAGSMAAYEAARPGVRVLLVDRACFPRQKVCGCCLNGAALEILNRAGLGQLPAQLGAAKLSEFRLAHRRRIATVPLHEGVSLSRARLDAALVEAAVNRGVHFLDGTRALVEELESGFRRVELALNDRTAIASGRVVVVASGLGARCFLRRQEDGRYTSRSSRIGAGVLLSDPSVDFEAGVIYMACNRDGYVGLVRLEDGQLDVAASLDGAALKGAEIGQVVSDILDESGFPLPQDLQRAQWRGTPRLSQRRIRVWGQQYFVVGDAAGYVEPFTGEGIAWALATGRAVAPFALESLTAATSAAGRAWAAKHRQVTGRRMRLCRAISYSLRRPTLAGLAVRLLARYPGLARPIVRSLNASFTG